MKTTKKQFELFKRECRYWVERFKLDNYRIYFSWDADERTYAQCSVNLKGQNCTFWFTKNWNNEIRPLNNEEIKEVAKHEVIHALLGRLTENSFSRFVTEIELAEAEEELVRKLQNLII